MVRFDAETRNGKIDSDFAVKSTDKKARKSKGKLHGTVGDNPAVTIKVRVSNGSVELRQQK